MIADILDVMEEFRPSMRAAGSTITSQPRKSDEDSLLDRLVALKPLEKGKNPAWPRIATSSTRRTGESPAAALDGTLAEKDRKGRQRSGVEKRRSLGFLLFALARVQTLDGARCTPWIAPRSSAASASSTRRPTNGLVSATSRNGC